MDELEMSSMSHSLLGNELNLLRKVKLIIWAFFNNNKEKNKKKKKEKKERKPDWKKKMTQPTRTKGKTRYVRLCFVAYSDARDNKVSRLCFD